jgi:hypothetical protein
LIHHSSSWGLVQVGDRLAGPGEVVERPALGGLADLVLDPGAEVDPGWLAIGHGVMLQHPNREGTTWATSSS